MSGLRGSKKPILTALPSNHEILEREELLPCLDGRRLTAIDVLVEVHGDIEIACERTDLSEAEFGKALARCAPSRLAEGFKALQLLQVFNLASKVGRAIEDRLDEEEGLKISQLIGFYPKLVELIPVLSESKLAVHAHQTNNFNLGPNGQGVEVPPDVAAAMKRLGMALPSG